MRLVKQVGPPKRRPSSNVTLGLVVAIVVPILSACLVETLRAFDAEHDRIRAIEIDLRVLERSLR